MFGKLFDDIVRLDRNILKLQMQRGRSTKTDSLCYIMYIFNAVFSIFCFRIKPIKKKII